MEEKLNYRINVSGQVQGVGFRWNAAREARKNGLSGFIRNQPDGSVFIEAEGSEPGLNNFVEWCRKGPRSAFVEDVKVEKTEVRNYTDFQIE